VDAQWQAFVAAKRIEELERIIAEENLDPEATRSFVDNAFRDGSIPVTGTAVTKILAPVSRFSKTSGYAGKKQASGTSKQGSEHIFCAIIRVVNSVWNMRRTADAWILGCLSNG
jgi:type I site-specific restriction-modification system R (restriction) subunit